MSKKVDKSINNFFKALDKDKGVTGFSISLNGNKQLCFTKEEITKIANDKGE